MRTIQAEPGTMVAKLNSASLEQLARKLPVPKYDRSQAGQSMMHIGVGGFHRAHQALYTDNLLGQGGDASWGYCGIGILPHDARIRDVMHSQ